MISAVLVGLLLVLVMQAAQPSTIRTGIVDAARPALNATGLDQGWGVFAPDPRNMSLDFFARVHYEDGTAETWRFPEGGALVGDYWDYRWRKYLEYVVQDGWAGQTRRQLSKYIARRSHQDGRTPTRVVLVRRWHTIRPGESPPLSPIREQAYFSFNVSDEVLER